MAFATAGATGGKVIYLDPYLSDAAERLFGEPGRESSGLVGERALVADDTAAFDAEEAALDRTLQLFKGLAAAGRPGQR